MFVCVCVCICVGVVFMGRGCMSVCFEVYLCAVCVFVHAFEVYMVPHLGEPAIYL